MKKTAQLARISAALKNGKSITPIQALNSYGCFRLAARIHDLRKRGMRIKQKPVTNRKTGSTYASYALAK